MDDGKKGFVDAMAEHQKTYRSVMSVVTEQIDVIESSLASNVPIEVLVQELNEHFKLNTNSSTVNKCLYRLRKKRPRSDKFAETANSIAASKKKSQEFFDKHDEGKLPLD